jgi:hypothetical protein
MEEIIREHKQPRICSLIYLPQSFNGIDWHQQLLVAAAAVAVVGAGVGAGADAGRVSTINKLIMLSMEVNLL